MYKLMHSVCAYKMIITVYSRVSG